MKIGLDGAYAVAENRDRVKSGKGTQDCGVCGRVGYARDVISMLATDYPQWNLSVYTPKIGRRRRLRLIDELYNVEYRLPAPSGFTGRLWRLFGITNCLLPDKVDVYHGLNGELPLNIASAHVPSVVTVSDTAIFDRGAGVSEVWKKVRRYVMMESCRNATVIIADTPEVKCSLMKRLGIDGSKIDVVPPSGLTAQALEGVYKKAIELFNQSSTKR